MKRYAGIELRHLQSFCAVAEERSFTRGADRRHLAQQAVSQHVRQLEDAVGGPLFSRTTRNVDLTPAGEILLAESANILETLSDICTATRAAASDAPAALRVGYTPVFESEMRQTLSAMRQGPFIARLNAIEYWTPEAISGVLSHSLDTAIAFCPDPPSGLQKLDFPGSAVGAVIHVDDPLAAQAEVSAADLAEHLLVLYERDVSPVFFDVLLGGFRDIGAPEPIIEMPMFSRDYGSNIFTHPALATGHAFAPLVARGDESFPDFLTWRPLAPALLMGASLLYRSAATSAPLQALITRVAEMVA